MKNSLLLVGIPGCGKTTVIRQIMRMYPEAFEQIRPDLGAVPPTRKSELLDNIASGTRYISEWNSSLQSIDPKLLAGFVVIYFTFAPVADVDTILPQEAMAVMDDYRQQCECNNNASNL